MGRTARTQDGRVVKLNAPHNSGDSQFAWVMGPKGVAVRIRVPSYLQ